VHRNHFGRQIESFEAPLQLPFLTGEADPSPFPGVFIRAPVVEEILSTGESEEGPEVEIMAKLPGRIDRMKSGVSQAVTKNDSGDIIAVRQGSILGTSFHPELTDDARIHAWWLKQVLRI
jgi:5'-phosphate synthase pdxT subunit